jgi:hypothetical protein
MSFRSRALSWLPVLILSGSATVAWAADDACTGFKWNITQEHALFTKAPEAVTAGHDLASAPTMKAQQLYELTLAPQDTVKFVAPPGKKSLADGAFAGVVHLKVPAAGSYRISLDAGFWIDVVSHQKLIDSTDFGGMHGCDAPRKVVIFNLPAGDDLVLQISQAAKDHVRVTLTPGSAQ